MADQSSIDAFAAAAEAVLPATDGKPSAAERNVHLHIVELIEKSLPGYVDLIAQLLNAYAADVRPVPFAELSIEERGAVFRAMSSDESRDIRDAVDGLLIFTLGGAYSEWTGYDRATRRLDPPAVWQSAGYHGPVAGVPDYREDA